MFANHCPYERAKKSGGSGQKKGKFQEERHFDTWLLCYCKLEVMMANRSGNMLTGAA